MTQHNHSERVDGCFRCDLSADEVRQIDDIAAGIAERWEGALALMAKGPCDGCPECAADEIREGK